MTTARRPRRPVRLANRLNRERRHVQQQRVAGSDNAAAVAVPPADVTVDLGLLADVAAGHVYRVQQPTVIYDMNRGTWRRCTRSTKPAAAAGLIELGPAHATGVWYWHLTDAGRAALDAGRGAT